MLADEVGAQAEFDGGIADGEALDHTGTGDLSACRTPGTLVFGDVSVPRVEDSGCETPDSPSEVSDVLAP